MMFNKVLQLLIVILTFIAVMSTVLIIYKGATFDDRVGLECVKAGKNWTLDGDWKHECQ